MTDEDNERNEEVVEEEAQPAVEEDEQAPDVEEGEEDKKEEEEETAGEEQAPEEPAAVDDAMDVVEDNKPEEEQGEEDKPEEDKEEEATAEDADAVADEEEAVSNKEEESEKENKDKQGTKRGREEDEVIADEILAPVDPEFLKLQDLIENTPKTSELEQVLYSNYKIKEAQVERLTGEILKLKAFISKRKQTYKRKRKDEGAPTRALSAYNIFVQDRFSQLAKENELALKSTDTDAKMKRVPPASLVASTGNQWKELSPDKKTVYEERARVDRKRYEEQMAKYQPPDKQANRKRNKTGYNMFFSAHVLRLKQSEAGVPSERGSVARLVGNAWKQLTAEEKQYYEREADKMNGMNPVDKDDEEEEGDDKRAQVNEYPAAYPMQHGEMHMHPGMAMHPQHDPRAQQHAYHYPPNYAYPQPPYGYGHHEQAPPQGQRHHYQQREAHPHYQYHGHYSQRM